MLRKITPLFFLFLFSTPGFAEQALLITNAWIPQAPPVARMHAGYLHIKNTSGQNIEIVSVQSPDYESVEMHKTVTQDGMSRMLEQDRISIAPGGEVDFERGALHLMLMQPKRKLKIGDSVQMTFTTADNRTIPFTASVKAATLDADDHSHHHH